MSEYSLQAHICP